MPRQVSCKVAKKINSTIRKKITAALKDIKNKQPRSASTKLYQAGDLIHQSTKGVWDKRSSLWIENETKWLSFQLCNDVTMRLPKWQSRTETILSKLTHIEQKIEARCK
jgi:hypothetical protein